MRLPRRTCFCEPAVELANLYALLYPSSSLPPAQADELRSRGVELIQSLYLLRGGCPIAVELSATLVSCILLDHQITSNGASRSTSSFALLSLRQSLSSALIRFVNSLVDSHQSGLYARSIATIAQDKLGLPGWLVEIRHRGTHEELPSLEVGREAVGAALAWLEQRYWRSVIAECKPKGAGDEADEDEIEQWTTDPSRSAFASSSRQADQKAQTLQSTLPELRNAIASYKRCGKSAARDESLQKTLKPEMKKALGQINRWIYNGRHLHGEQPSSNSALRRSTKRAHRGESEGCDSGDEDGAETDTEIGQGLSVMDPVLKALAEELLLPGALVPIAKTKRAGLSLWAQQEQIPVSSADFRDLRLPRESILTWRGFLVALFNEHENLAPTMVVTLLSTITASGPGSVPDSSNRASSETLRKIQELFVADATYRAGILCWLRVMIDTTTHVGNLRALMCAPPMLAAPLHQILHLTGSARMKFLTSVARQILRATRADKQANSSSVSVLRYILSRDRQMVPQLEVVIRIVESMARDPGSVDEAEALLEGFEGMDSADSEDLQSGELMVDMEKRYRQLVGSNGRQEKAIGGTQSRDSATEAIRTEVSVADVRVPRRLPSGWSIERANPWNPSPMGCLASSGPPDFLGLRVQVSGDLLA